MDSCGDAGREIEMVEAPAMVGARAEAITANGGDQRDSSIKDGRDFRLCLRLLFVWVGGSRRERHQDTPFV